MSASAGAAWPTPHLGAFAVVGTVLAAGWLVVRVLIGQPGDRELRRRHAAGEQGVLVVLYRRIVARQAVLAAVVLMIVALDGALTRRAVGLVRSSGRSSGFWTGYAFVLSAAVLLTALVVGGIVRGRPLKARLGRATKRAIPLPKTGRERLWAAGVAVGAGVSEELLFRGLFLAALVAAFGGHRDLAVTIVTIGFGLAHAARGTVGIIFTTVLGAVFALLYFKTHSLLPAVVFHAGWDIAALAMMPVRPEVSKPAPAGPAGRTGFVVDEASTGHWTADGHWVPAVSQPPNLP